MLLYHKHQFIASDRTLEFYFVGCPYKCKNCHNKELFEILPTNHKKVEPEDIFPEIKEYVLITKQVHILGGEPLAQPHDELKKFTKLLKEWGFKNIILFTGAKEDYVLKHMDLFEYVDFVKYGRYKEELPKSEKDANTGIVLASNNQKIIRISPLNR